MAKLFLPYDLANLTPADANPPEQNFNSVQTHVNSELIERDGSVAMRQQLRLVGNPVNHLDAVPKEYADQLVPIGALMPFAGAFAPGITAGGHWLLCDGTEYQTADYTELFNVIGTAYVTGTPSAGRFRVPDLRQRFPMGGSIGATGGSANAVIPYHQHTMNHDHPQVVTGDNLSHHSHDVNGVTGYQSVNHTHAMRGVEGPAGGAVSAFGLSRVLDYATGGSNPVIGSTSNPSDNHRHVVDLGASNETMPHQHMVDIPNYTGNTGFVGTTGNTTNANLPPYVGFNFIIRAK